MNASPAHELSRTTLTPHHDPAELVGRWTRVHDGRADRVGVLLHATRAVSAGTQGWEWALRTPDGVVTGMGELRATPLCAHGRGEARSTRRRLRAARADLVEFADPGDPALSEVTADLDLMELELAAQP
ncbi:hypothetical protein KIK06_05025 [Nocardiopsis sp. EMB25]|uniref:hypothetical protein n=1 Tax=Nocardiopsis TaxID=2013 RepID=UPI00034882E0|nr:MULTISPECIES: hypothetical protein [Nocardiopsis]MCY9783255.1 hypothetical protein [Nocardiopsis sp. EMB25]